jgi:hypothetical protein
LHTAANRSSFWGYTARLRYWRGRDGARDSASSAAHERGNGSFRGDPNPTFLAETYSTMLVALQNFDGDRNLDALVSNGLAAGSFLFFGRGDGSFKNPVPTTAVVATDLLTDVNGDRRADLVSTQSSVNSVSVSLGNGDGSFQRPGIYAVDGPPGRVTVGDFNSDGRADLATVSVTTGTVSVLLGNGDGTFQSARHFAAGPSPGSVTVGDFNGDGWIDLVAGNSLDSAKPALSVMFNDGNW